MSGSFEKGYLDGCKTVSPGILPGIPSHSIPAGKTEYQAGFDRGVEDAKERKRPTKPK